MQTQNIVYNILQTGINLKKFKSMLNHHDSQEEDDT
jgi:hypothetical protein